jgi:hypothetical protein
MKRIILSKIENEILISSLEELHNSLSDTELADTKWFEKLKPTWKLFELELAYYKIRDDKQLPTKKQMVKWLIIKIKNKTADLS